MDLSISDSELNDRCHAAELCQASALRLSLWAVPAGAIVLVSAHTAALGGRTHAHWVWLWPGGGMVLRRQRSLDDDIRVTKSAIGPAAASALRERLEGLSLWDFLPRWLSHPQ